MTYRLEKNDGNKGDCSDSLTLISGNNRNYLKSINQELEVTVIKATTR